MRISSSHEQYPKYAETSEPGLGKLQLLSRQSWRLETCTWTPTTRMLESGNLRSTTFSQLLLRTLLPYAPKRGGQSTVDGVNRPWSKFASSRFVSSPDTPGLVWLHTQLGSWPRLPLTPSRDLEISSLAQQHKLVARTIWKERSRILVPTWHTCSCRKIHVSSAPWPKKKWIWQTQSRFSTHSINFASNTKEWNRVPDSRLWGSTILAGWREKNWMETPPEHQRPSRTGQGSRQC